MYEQLFDKLESDQLSATLNVVSGLKQFVNALASAVEVQELLASVRSSRDPGVVAERFDQVAARETDPTYENPWDVALAAYLHVLAQVDPKQAVVCAERALTSPNCWWSSKIADSILSGHEGSPLEEVPGRPSVSTGALTSSPTADTYLPHSEKYKMGSTRIEELLEQLVDQNTDVISKLDDILTEVREIKEELNWIGDTAFTKRVIDGLDA